MIGNPDKSQVMIIDKRKIDHSNETLEIINEATEAVWAVKRTVVTIGGNLNFNHHISNIWDKVSKNGPSKICRKQSFKNLKRYTGLLNPFMTEAENQWTGFYMISASVMKGLLSRPYPFKFFEGCLLQILLGPFLNTLSHVDLQLINSMHLFDWKIF